LSAPAFLTRLARLKGLVHLNFLARCRNARYGRRREKVPGGAAHCANRSPGTTDYQIRLPAIEGPISGQQTNNCRDAEGAVNGSPRRGPVARDRPNHAGWELTCPQGVQ